MYKKRLLAAKNSLDLKKLALESASANPVVQPMVVNSSNDETDLFLSAVKGVRLLQNDRAIHPTKKPIPKKFNHDEQQALADSLSDHFIPAYELDAGEHLRYLREGHSPDILRKLHHGHWPVQAAIDLHGMISDAARLYVSTFISDCKSRGIRCVRIVHGKGLSSRNQEPVLKNKLRSWLMQKDEIIAYVEAKKQDGGSGAVIVLLKA